MKTKLSLKHQKSEFFNTKTTRKINPIYSVLDINKKGINVLRQKYLNKPELTNSNYRNNYNTYIKELKNILMKKGVLKFKSRNNTMKFLFKNNSFNINNNTNKKENINFKNTKNKNYILLTSLYKLPLIKNRKQINNKPISPISSKVGLNNSYIPNNSNIPHNNSFCFNNKKNINESVYLSYNESFNNNDTSKNNNEVNYKEIIKKRYSKLNDSMREKYYIDIEKKLNHKLDAKSFPSDHSIKDKIIHMKKVSIFWNSVFKYCSPIINGKKYQFQHILEEKKQLKNLKLNENNYNFSYKNLNNRNGSKTKIYSPKIINKLKNIGNKISRIKS